MPTLPTLLTFAFAATLLIIVPGPNVIYIITRGIDQGRKAAIVSAAGVEVGMLFHIGAAVLGLSALVASSEIVFNVVKYAGAAYLIWMGITAVHGVDGGNAPTARAPHAGAALHAGAYRQRAQPEGRTVLYRVSPAVY